MSENEGEQNDANRDRNRDYVALYSVDVRTGRCFTHSTTLLVPWKLAQVINAVRVTLQDQRRHDARAWREAGLIPAFELQPENAHPDWYFRAKPASPATAADAGSAASDATPAAAKQPGPRLPAGRRVKVISKARISARRQQVELRTKFSTEEKKTELKMLDALLARGEMRVVGMPKSWRARLAALRADMPHFGAVIDRIEACLALAEFTRTPARLPPMLLAGPPGVGKTHFAIRLAALIGVQQFV